jgi:ABC-type Fe3+/spermidine/putrescine transport system ATPase subunit
LLDEPLSALDEKIRREMQAQLKDIQRVTGTTFVYVTHDQEEALTMSDRVAVLNWGHLVQVDEPHALFRRPQTKFVASFFRGSNVVEGELTRDDGRDVFRCSSFQTGLPAPLALPASPAAVAIRGEDIRINEHGGSDDIRFEGVLERITYRGVYTDYQLRLADGQTIIASATSGADLRVGLPVKVAVRTDKIVPLRAEPA